MNELTLELFETIAGAELDEEGRQRVFAWLSALLRMPYLEQREKWNALHLLDSLEKLEGPEGGEPLAPLYRTVRARLCFERPKAWTMDWPENYQVSVDGQNLTPEDLRRRGVGHVDFRLTKPIRNSTEFVVVRRLHAGGRIEVLPEYQVFDTPPVGERHMFHVYGEKAVNHTDR